MRFANAQSTLRTREFDIIIHLILLLKRCLPKRLEINLRKVQKRNTLIGKVIGGDSYKGENTPARGSVRQHR